MFTCGACGAELFKSGTKFDSSCGWPSFYESVRPEAVELIEDMSLGMSRTEVRCANCGSHLGHVFPDGFGTPDRKQVLHEFGSTRLPGGGSGIQLGEHEIAQDAAALLRAIGRRRSYPAVTADAPSHDQLLPLVAAAARVADHGSLRPWRLLELRGTARDELGAALAQASRDAQHGEAPETAELRARRMAAKPLRAPLLIAIVAVHRPSIKVTMWEQDAAAAGVAHLLSLVLDIAGWGVMWRTGAFTDAPPVRAVHRLQESEHLLGWLYVGGRPPGSADHKPHIDPTDFLATL